MNFAINSLPRWMFMVLPVSLLVLTLAACEPMLLEPVEEGSVSTPSAESTTEPTEEAEEEATEEPVETRTNGESGADLSDTEQALVEEAMSILAQEQGLSGEEISLVEIEAVEWPDSSLGCPQPDMMYAQVITPGYRITLEAGGETYDVHTGSQEGSPVVLCTED